MKLFKKLLAAALAGVLALTLLTGCSGAVNKSQLVDILNDLHFLDGYSEYYDQRVYFPEVKTIVQGDSKLATQLLNNVANFVTEHPDNYLSTNGMLMSYDDFDPTMGANRICPKDAKDIYYYTWLRLDDFQSKEFQQNRTYHIAERLYRVDCLNDFDRDCNPSMFTYADTATASIATKKIGDYEYLAIVFVQKCTGENTARPD